MAKNWRELVSQPKYKMRLEEDVWVTMPDGVRLLVDIYRPDAEGKFPVLVSYSMYGKDAQKLPTNPKRFEPSDYIRGTGGHEAGMTDYFVPRGYVHIIPDARGMGGSEGDPWIYYEQDCYDLIEWAAQQPWSNGNVGMLGMSAFAEVQYAVAAMNPPHLKAIFPFEGETDEYRHEWYHGGILGHNFALHLGKLCPAKLTKPRSYREFTPEVLKQKVKELQNNPDIRGCPYLYIITQVPEKHPSIFDALLHPYDGPYWEGVQYTLVLDKIKCPAYLASRWNGWAIHLPGAFDAYDKIRTPKKLLITTTDNFGGFDRPWHEHHDIVLRWYDHWLKGLDTGLMQEPPISIFVQGKNEWRYENEWPLARTKWTKFYLRERGGLSEIPPEPNERPQKFTNDPWANPTEGFGAADECRKADPIPRAIYSTKPLKEDCEVTGPIALHLHASINTNNTNWFIEVKDIDEDGSERLVSMGWLRASRRELDESKSKPYAPYQAHTRDLPVEPGKVYEYPIDVRMTSNVFKAGHKIQLEIAGQDRLRAIWYHLLNMTETEHTIYNDSQYQSYLLLPIIPK
jgi:putative CocE/NonD family hydrolase